MMDKWVKESCEALEIAEKMANESALIREELYKLASVIYSKYHNVKDESILKKMDEENERQYQRDISVDDESSKEYKFHFVSSFLYCYVVDGKIDERKYDNVMEFVNDEMDLFL